MRPIWRSTTLAKSSITTWPRRGATMRARSSGSFAVRQRTDRGEAEHCTPPRPTAEKAPATHRKNRWARSRRLLEHPRPAVRHVDLVETEHSPADRRFAGAGRRTARPIRHGSPSHSSARIGRSADIRKRWNRHVEKGPCTLGVVAPGRRAAGFRSRPSALRPAAAAVRLNERCERRKYRPLNGLVRTDDEQRRLVRDSGAWRVCRQIARARGSFLPATASDLDCLASWPSSSRSWHSDLVGRPERVNRTAPAA